LAIALIKVWRSWVVQEKRRGEDKILARKRKESREATP